MIDNKTPWSYERSTRGESKATYLFLNLFIYPRNPLIKAWKWGSHRGTMYVSRRLLRRKNISVYWNTTWLQNAARLSLNGYRLLWLDYIVKMEVLHQGAKTSTVCLWVAEQAGKLSCWYFHNVCEEVERLACGESCSYCNITSEHTYQKVSHCRPIMRWDGYLWSSFWITSNVRFISAVKELHNGILVPAVSV